VRSGSLFLEWLVRVDTLAVRQRIDFQTENSCVFEWRGGPDAAGGDEGDGSKMEVASDLEEDEVAEVAAPAGRRRITRRQYRRSISTPQF